MTFTPETVKTVENMRLEAGRLCLNFANTADWHASENPVECLNEYRDLITWSRRTETLTEAEARRLLREAAARPVEAARTLREAVELREALYDIFVSQARGEPPAPEALEILNRHVARALSQSRLQTTEDGFGWGWREAEGALDQMLWPVARSAADLLTSEERERVGQCADDRGCGYLFLDLSRNRSRRWCDMKDCGNRAKARRHYQKQRAAR